MAYNFDTVCIKEIDPTLLCHSVVGAFVSEQAVGISNLSNEGRAPKAQSVRLPISHTMCTGSSPTVAWRSKWGRVLIVKKLACVAPEANSQESIA